MIITIDGQSGLGKSTISKKLADYLHIEHISSGKIYRFVTLCFLNTGEKFDEDKAISFIKDADLFLACGINDSLLRRDDITKSVNKIAEMPKVRMCINDSLRRQCKGRNFVIDGRDACLIFPEADYKFVFYASVDDRLWLAEKRKGKNPVDYLQLLHERDAGEIQIKYPEDVTYINSIDILRLGNGDVLSTILHTIHTF